MILLELRVTLQPSDQNIAPFLASYILLSFDTSILKRLENLMLERNSLALLILVYNEREPRGYLMDLSSFMLICDTGENYALGDSDSL